MADISKIIETNRPPLHPYEALYKEFHANPELSFQEEETAAKVVSYLSRLNEFTVHHSIGRSTGVAAVFENKNGGEGGPIVLLRADMDALPVEEKTGLEYASKKRMVDSEGNEKPVMHACGHDMHVTSLLAAAELLVKAKENWRGTVILVFQPAEEKGAGARQMVEGGLYELVPKPDVAIGAHVLPLRTGVIGTKRDLVAFAADSFHGHSQDIPQAVAAEYSPRSSLTIYGRQGHGSQPHCAIDPIVLAASTILRLQTIVAREISPYDSAVVSVGAIHAGDAENIIPETAELKINVRNGDATTRKKVLDSVKRIINAEAQASNVEKMPVLKSTSSFPFTINDPDSTARIEESFSKHFGTGPHTYSSKIDKLPGSEDFGILASSIDRPAVFFVYGGVDPETWDKAEKEGRIAEDIPVNHSPFFAPVIQPTLQVAVDGYAAAALAWLAI